MNQIMNATNYNYHIKQTANLISEARLKRQLEKARTKERITVKPLKQ